CVSRVLETSKSSPAATIKSIYHVSRTPSRCWSLQVVTFTAEDAQIAHSWVQAIQKKITQTGHTRPKKLLVFINPYGGRGKASKIYYTKVSPLFQLVGIESHVIETTRVNYARDYLMEADLQRYDGIVCVGGDGMFSELLHGLLKRTQSDSGITEDKEDAKLIPCSLRIGIIPAGSTNCVCYATVGVNDPVTSALHIIVGDTQPLDVCSLHHNGKFVRYSSSLIGYGFFGDVLKESEKLRKWGPKRYTYAGIKMVLSNRSYRGTIEYQEARDSSSSPRDNTRCRTGCRVCLESSERQQSGSQESLSESWTKFTGSFMALNITVMSCACPNTKEGLSPSAHLADGTADLILVRQCRARHVLRYLIRNTNHKDQFALPHVEVHRIRALRFTAEEPDSDIIQETSWRCNLFGKKPTISSWNCDGEMLCCTQLDVRVHHRLIHLFARGIEDT
ncbi:ceramide kinase-like, partial [Hyla sarda]|uniref:ceramide kinase-like n=1 Tax=Hyla sarda TaxID=327740 RepID=UPI0024C37C3F